MTYCRRRVTVLCVASRGKNRTLLLHSQGPSEQNPIKNFVEKPKGAWAYLGTAHFLVISTPYYPRNGKSYERQMLWYALSYNRLNRLYESAYKIVVDRPTTSAIVFTYTSTSSAVFSELHIIYLA